MKIMDQVYVVVVKEGANDSSASAWTNSWEERTLAPCRLSLDPRRKYQVAVWRAVQKQSKRCMNRDAILGMAAVLGISVASWTGVAVLISRLVR